MQPTDRQVEGARGEAARVEVRAQGRDLQHRFRRPLGERRGQRRDQDDLGIVFYT